MYYLTAEAAFDSAHFLAGYEGKCSNLHGHRWRVQARIAGKTLQETGDKAGMLVDFSELKRALHRLADDLDHRLLIEEGTLHLSTLQAMALEHFSLVTLPFRPTAENLAKHLFAQMQGLGFPIDSMTVYETPDNCATYEEDKA